MEKTSNVNERQRIKRILEGRSEEFAYFVNTYAQAVVDFTSRLVHSTADAEDLAQDSFVKAFHNLSSFRGQSSFQTWVCRIAYHEALNHLRHIQPQYVDIDEVPMAEAALDEELSTGSEERIAMMEEAVGDLPAEEQLLLHLYYYEDRPLREIAYIVDAEPANLSLRLHRIRKKLLRMIKQKEYGQAER